MLRSYSVCRVLLLSSAAFLTVSAASAKSYSSRDHADPVVVDVVVTDANNQPVKGLTAQDFHVFENKKPQQIRSFEAHQQPAEVATTKAAILPGNTFTDAGSSVPASFNVVLLDQLNTSIQDQALAVRELNQFLAHKPADAAYAIFSLRNDEIACKPYRQDLWTYGSKEVDIPNWDSGCSAMGRLLLVQGFTTDNDRLTAAIQGNDSAQPHATWLRVQLSNVAACGLPPLHDCYNGSGTVMDTTMPSLAELSNFLQALPGRKSLLWMSDNFDAAPVPLPNDMWFPPKFKGWDDTDIFSQTQMNHLTASRIARARVAVYPVDLTGKNKTIYAMRVSALAFGCGRTNWNLNPWFGWNLNPFCQFDTFAAAGFPIQPKMPSWDVTDAGGGPRLDRVADQTGGRAFHKADSIAGALERAGDDAAHYYTLTYFPSKAKLDGKPREIKVSLGSNDYRLTYEKTYYADDPRTVSRPDGNAVADVYLPNPTGPMPWMPLRIVPQGPSQSAEPPDPILPALEYAMPESPGVVFSARVEPTQKPAQATPAQMAQLQDFESFKAERIAKAMENLTKEEKKTQHKGRTVLPPLDSLPAPNPVLLQPYSIDYSIPIAQLPFRKDASGTSTIKLEVAVLAYDALGKKVTGLQQVLDVSLSAAELQQVQASGYHLSQSLDVPDRVTVIRLAVRDESGGNMGSLEVPLWAIQSPYRRKQLRLPVDVGKSATEQQPPANNPPLATSTMPYR